MILITVGTQVQQFPRIIEYGLKLIEKEKLEDYIFIQRGSTDCQRLIDAFKGKNKIVCQQYFSDFSNILSQTDIVITHGGVGTIIQALQQQKKIFVVPRLSKYSEHIDDHQIEITTKLSSDNYLIKVLTFSEMENQYLNLKKGNIKFTKFKTNNQNFNNHLYSIIDELNM